MNNNDSSSLAQRSDISVVLDRFCLLLLMLSTFVNVWMNFSFLPVVSQARRLRELFRGRFDQTVAERLIEEFGGEGPAADFLLNEDQEQVTRYLRESPEYLENMRRDSQAVASILNNQLESSVRQFACGPCNRSWWRRVPLRKEVSKCRRCHVKYDPIPRDKESGWGKFICPCGKEFTSFAEMGVTTCECYQCGVSVPVDHMLPPRRRMQRKTNAPHSCNAENCYNQSQSSAWGGADPNFYDQNYNFHEVEQFGGRGNREPRDSARDPGQNPYAQDNAGGAYPGQPAVPVCIHPKSSKPARKIRTTSRPHVSTGSTVSTFLTQGSMETGTVSVAYTMESISENDDE